MIVNLNGQVAQQLRHARRPLLRHPITLTATRRTRTRSGSPGTPMSLLRFIKLLVTKTFPGGQLPGIDTVASHAAVR